MPSTSVIITTTFFNVSLACQGRSAAREPSVGQVDQSLNGRCIRRVLDVRSRRVVVCQRLWRRVSARLPHWPRNPPGERTKVSSPFSAMARNSSLAEPPMAPDMACTMTYSKPSRSKILMYASRWAVVRLGQALIVDVEGVGVLHHELAAAQQSGSRACFVAVLRLDLVERQAEGPCRRSTGPSPKA